MAGSLYASVFGGGSPTAPVPVLSGVSFAAGAATETLKANTALALIETDATTTIYSRDTRNTVTAVKTHTFRGCPPTIAGASGTTYSQVGISTVTLTTSTQTTITALDGLGLYIDAPTVAQSGGAVTVTTLSNLYVALPVAGSSVTGTNIYSAHFAGAVLVDGNIVVNSAAAAVTVKAATAATLVVSDGTTSVLSIDSRLTTSGTASVTLTGVPITLTSAGSALTAPTLKVAARTTTLTGTTTTTSLFGLGAYLDAPTVTDASVCTLSAASNLHIVALAAAGGSLTITASYMVSTSVAGCFLTNAGVWTDQASGRSGKSHVCDAGCDDVLAVLDQVQTRTWKYDPSVHGDDAGRQRFGIVADELPEALRVPGPYGSEGVSAGVLASFALAALKHLRDENEALKARLDALEGTPKPKRK